MPKDPLSTLINMAENGIISWETIAQECLQRMSTDEIQDMIDECDWCF